MTSTSSETPTDSQGCSDPEDDPGETQPEAEVYVESILSSLRRIIRAGDRHSGHLSRTFHLTVFQLVFLKQPTVSRP